MSCSGFHGRKGSETILRRGSKKGLSTGHLEGRNTPFRAYDPFGARHVFQGARTVSDDATVPM